MRLNVAILVAFGLVVLAASYWTIVRGPNILARSDNPRLVEAELKVRRGAILDVNSQVLAVTSEVNEQLRRVYPLPPAAPAVGYYSLRYGTSGIEEAFDGYLRGESDDFWSSWWQTDILGERQAGRDLRLTVDARWQERASSLLGERNGAVLLFSLPDVAVRAMASSPGYDPNSLDSDFDALVADEDAPLLNRVTQSQYQPGLLLQPFLMAVAARDGLIDLGEAAKGADEVIVVDGVALSCLSANAEVEMTWFDALGDQCPGPMVALGQRMGADELLAALEAFGLTGEPGLLGPEEDEEPGVADVGLAAIGQDLLAINPMQVGIALATLANDGQLRPAQLVAANQNESGQWTAIRPAATENQAVPSRVARQILTAFKQGDGILEREVVVLSGPEGELNGWYLGLAPAADPRYVVVVVVEDEYDVSSAPAIGRRLLKAVLDPEGS